MLASAAGFYPSGVGTVLEILSGFAKTAERTVVDYSLLRRRGGPVAGWSSGSLLFKTLFLGNKTIPLFTGVSDNLLTFRYQILQMIAIFGSSRFELRFQASHKFFLSGDIPIFPGDHLVGRFHSLGIGEQRRLVAWLLRYRY